MARTTKYRVSRGVITRANNRVGNLNLGKVNPTIVSHAGDIKVSVKYSGKIIEQTLTSQDVKTAYATAVKSVSYGKEVQ